MVDISGIRGISIGHATDEQGGTGCTVVLCEDGAVCGVDVRGSAPGTRETDLLDPVNLVDRVHAVLLAGGSAYGLDAASGVMEYLEEKNKGFDTGVAVVPIVPAAVIYDLNIGSPFARPDAKMGYEACVNAGKLVEEGSIGAGTGATVGKFFGIERAMKGGVGIYVDRIGDFIIGALAVVNSLGDVVHPETGRILAGVLDPKRKKCINAVERLADEWKKINVFPGQNTTLGVVFTSASLTKAQAKKVSQMAHDGLARVIKPVHTMYDGDTIFTLATGEKELKGDLSIIGHFASVAVEKAVIRAVLKAKKLHGIPAYEDINKGLWDNAP